MIMDISQEKERKKDETMIFAHAGDKIAVVFPSVGVKVWFFSKGEYRVV